MGGIFNPGAPGITILSIDRELGPGAGSGQLGNRVIMFGLNAGAGSTASDMVILGNNAMPVATTVSGNLDGSVIMGVNDALVLKSSRLAALLGNVLIGSNIMTAAVQAGGNTVIGNSALKLAIATVGTGALEQNVVIGQEAGGAVARAVGTIFGTSVVIGYQAAQGSANVGNFQNVVCIGDQAAQNWGSANGSINLDVIIGYQACQSAASSGTNTQNVFIGNGAGLTANGASENICIGAATLAGLQGVRNVVIGSAAGSAGGFAAAGANNIAIGYNAGNGLGQLSRNVLIGNEAGHGALAAQNDRLLIETWTGAVLQTFVAGDFALGNYAFGSLSPANRNTFLGAGGSNRIMITNGTIGAANPTGGGYFYVTGGALHYVGSAGTDTPLAPA